ncbi:MAG: S-adenosylmethionine:tRNA ribosyltransferase-isomerase [Tannerellaceae bacterium]|nr:S-adenosylmethionine:tRNA ribosyltransferase-isomerase [Tannerellaceae bacterium]
MTVKTQHIQIEEYNYSLPDERIAKFPLSQRDESRLLIYRNGKIEESIFKDILHHLPEKALVVFNNTRVIQARLLFRKETGAQIEIFCLEPVAPHDYALIFQQTERCTWNCLVGNLKKWKEGPLTRTVEIDQTSVMLKAEKKESCGDSHRIEFTWDDPEYTFADLLEAAGELPIPPYLHRDTEESDLETYQTVYSKIKGSVAAPTAGLHFTPKVLTALDDRGFLREEVTLHVGAGTFRPVKSETIAGHEMHTEFISMEKQTIRNIRENIGQIIAVGTTSVRTLESLYYIGVILSREPAIPSEALKVSQWIPYDPDYNRLPVQEALWQIENYLERNRSARLVTSTQIMIAPGYQFKIVNGIITNFHQPKSTLLLLISAFVKGNWKTIYDYALANDFRFLSYGDSSLLLE